MPRYRGGTNQNSQAAFVWRVLSQNRFRLWKGSGYVDGARWNREEDGETLGVAGQHLEQQEGLWVGLLH